MPELPTAFHDLPADKFPFIVEFISSKGMVVHRIEVASPGVVKIPGLSPLFGPVSTRVTFADGTVVTEPAPRA